MNQIAQLVKSCPLFLPLSLFSALAGCGGTKSEAQVVRDRPPYLSVCRGSNANEDQLLFDSRLVGGVQSASFYSISGANLAKIALFSNTWNENVAGRVAGLPPEADRYMIQRGANMDGERILSGYELIFPMKTAGANQQMVGEDILKLRAKDRLWEVRCRQLDSGGEEYQRFLKEVNQ